MSNNMTENINGNQYTQNITTIADENSPNTFCIEEKFKSQNLEEFNLNALNGIYAREDSFFRKNIDKLNQKFYAETNKYLTIKSELEKSHDNLFCILFKQISHYIEEIDKLNSRLKERDENVKFYKNRVEEVFIVSMFNIFRLIKKTILKKTSFTIKTLLEIWRKE